MEKELLRTILPALPILAGLCLVTGIGRAQDDASAVLAAHRAFRGIWAKSDSDALAKILSQDFIWITRGGTKSDKAGMVMAVREHRTTSPQYSEQLRVRIYGTIGVVTEVDFGANASTKAPANTTVTEIWNKTGSGWVLILFQGSPVLNRN